MDYKKSPTRKILLRERKKTDVFYVVYTGIEPGSLYLKHQRCKITLRLIASPNLASDTFVVAKLFIFSQSNEPNLFRRFWNGPKLLRLRWSRLVPSLSRLRHPDQLDQLGPRLRDQGSSMLTRSMRARRWSQTSHRRCHLWNYFENSANPFFSTNSLLNTF